MNSDFAHRPCPYAACGYNPFHSAACSLIRRTYGPCPAPCDTPCYLAAQLKRHPPLDR